MIVALFLLLILLVVAAAGVFGVDSREGGDRASRGSGPFHPDRRFD